MSKCPHSKVHYHGNQVISGPNTAEWCQLCGCFRLGTDWDWMEPDKQEDHIHEHTGHWQQNDENWQVLSDRTENGLTENSHAKCRVCNEWVPRGFTPTHKCNDIEE